MTQNSKASCKPLQYYARSVHRVLGYLAVGLVLVFSLSGIMLVHRTGDFMKRSEHVEKSISPGLDEAGLTEALKLKKLNGAKTEGDMITFADGSYNAATGEVSYEKKDVVAPFSEFISLHKISDAKNRAVAAFITIFGIVLFLLPITALMMYKPSSAQFKRNMLYTAIGVVLAVVLVCVV